MLVQAMQKVHDRKIRESLEADAEQLAFSTQSTVPAMLFKLFFNISHVSAIKCHSQGIWLSMMIIQRLDP